MTVKHKRMSGVRLTLAAVAIVAVAPAAHAFTMDTIANSNGGSRYNDPGELFENGTSGQATAVQQHSFGGLGLSAGPGSGLSRSNPVGSPPDQRFMDR